MNRSMTAVVLFLCALMSACNSKTLTRSKAAELIKSARFNPKATEEDAQFLEFRPQTNGVVSDSDLTDLRRLEKAGWITIAVHSTSLFVSAVDVALTDRGLAQAQSWKQDQLGFWKIPTARREFVGVTGFAMRTPTLAAVEYTWRWVLTDRGRQLGIEPSEPSSASAEFQLFEDGWRMMK